MGLTRRTAAAALGITGGLRNTGGVNGGTKIANTGLVTILGVSSIGIMVLHGESDGRKNCYADPGQDGANY